MKKFTISREELQEVIERFPFKQDACKYLNIGIDTLRRVVNEYGLIYPRVSIFKGVTRIKDNQFIDKQWLVEHWVNTEKSIAQLAQEYSVSIGMLESRRAKYSLTKPFKYSLDINKFEDLSDIHIWYVAGLAATDGHLPINEDALSLDLTGESELKLLNSIADYYNSLSRPRRYGTSNRLRFAYPGLDKFLYENFRLTEGNKTYTIETPLNFPCEQHAKAYILGCLDGDGSIASNPASIQFTVGSKNLVLGILKLIEKYTGEHIPYHETRSGDKYYPSFSCTDRKARVILDWVYSIKSSCFFLERKFLRYKHVDDIV